MNLEQKTSLPPESFHSTIMGSWVSNKNQAQGKKIIELPVLGQGSPMIGLHYCTTVGRLLSKEGVEPKLAQSVGKDVAESLVKESDKQSNQLSESITLDDSASDALLFDTLLTVAGAVTNIGGKILGGLLSKGVEPEVAKKVADKAAKEIEAEMAK